MNKILILLITVFCSTVSIAQEKKEDDKKPIPVAKSFLTTHQGSFGGVTIKYKATASETYLTDSDGIPVASIWSTAYTKDNVLQVVVCVR